MAKGVSRNRRYRRPRWLGNIANIATAAYGAYRGAGALTRSQQRRRWRGGNGLTSQSDSKLVYRRRRMPPRKRARWVRFSRKVSNIVDKSLAPISLVRSAVSNQDGAINSQLIGACGLFFGFGRSDSADLYDDIARINADAAAYSEGTTTLMAQQKVRMTSGVIDVTFENRASDGAEVPTPTDMEVDVYEMLCIRDIYIDDVNQSDRDIIDFFNYACVQQNPPKVDKTGAAIGTQLSVSQLGWTPFDTGLVGKYFKVLKKTKKYMTPGGFFTYQMRSPGNRTVSGDKLFVAGDNGAEGTGAKAIAYKGLTRILLFICKGEPFAFSGAGRWSKPAFTLGQTKNFHYKVMEGSNKHAYVL